MHCYLRQGFGAKIVSPISGLLLEFMGEMFVDDTDLIVMRPELKTGRDFFLGITGIGMELGSQPKCYRRWSKGAQVLLVVSRLLVCGWGVEVLGDG